MNKKELRKEIRRRIALLSEEEKQCASEKVCKKIASSAVWKSARHVILYEAMADELSLQTLIELALEQGKRIQMPEPSAEAKPLTDIQGVDLIVVPGRAFTVQGDRMGRGKGYYDRLLVNLPCLKIGVAFQCQQVEELTTDSWDIAMDEVVFG